MKSILSLLGANSSQMLDVMIRTGLRAEPSRAGEEQVILEKAMNLTGRYPRLLDSPPGNSEGHSIIL